MPNLSRRLSALGTALAMASSGLFTSAVSLTVAVGSTAVPAAAADAPWTLPTVPPKCTDAQKSSGNVAGCVITLGPGLPEDRGWPKPPFPDAVPGDVLPWVDLAKGATGLVVAKVQTALNQNGATLDVDGQFGALTETAVTTYQTAKGLPATGVVDQATADLLGVQNTTFTFPPPGWSFLGWGYNGSPALATWEAQLVSNTTAIGSIKAGAIRSFPDALPLFAGFFAEIQAKGYVIGPGAGTYVFRCTSSTRKDCSGLTRDALSNHSYGLATDINVATNPQKTYYGINGASACQTPMQTDLPQWVVQTAEKWGLYWGGYGWSSGCSSPSQFRTSVTRDAMHFEFNGTVEQARAILRYNVGGACFDVASETGVISDRCLLRNEVPGAGTRAVIDTGAPAGATAALVNITTTSATDLAYVTAEDCGPRSGIRDWSNGNARPGRTTAAAAIVPIDADGRFCLYQSGTMHAIVDVQGFFLPAAAAPNGSLLTLASPQRSLDTRNGMYCAIDGTCLDRQPTTPGMEVANVASAPVDVTATMANITAVSPASGSYLTADACSTLTPGEQTRSNLNFAAGDVVSNLAVVPSANTDMGTVFCTYSPAGLHELIDVQGFFNPASQGGLGFTQQTPVRLVDTRQCWTDPVTAVQRCGKANPAGGIVRLRAPAGAKAVMVNLTTTGVTAPGYVTAGACSTIQPGPQTTSNVNAVTGADVANTALVPVDPDGTFCVYTSSTMHLIVDLLGSFAPDGQLRFQPVTPIRVHDSRQRV